MDVDNIAVQIQTSVHKNANMICVASTLTQLCIQLAISYALFKKETESNIKMANMTNTVSNK
jgi:hypothetical protein